jgi:hypothetical protein
MTKSCSTISARSCLRTEPGKLAEADIESLPICGDKLWICGSHCRFRAKPKKKPDEPAHVTRVMPHFKTRPSRHLFG